MSRSFDEDGPEARELFEMHNDCLYGDDWRGNDNFCTWETLEPEEREAWQAVWEFARSLAVMEIVDDEIRDVMEGK